MIKNYGERQIKGNTGKGIQVSMPIQIADVKRVLMSTHEMNESGLKVVLDGINSYFVDKRSNKSSPIKYEHGKYFFDVWAPSADDKQRDKKVDDDGDVNMNPAFNKGDKSNQCWVLGTDNSDVRGREQVERLSVRKSDDKRRR